MRYAKIIRLFLLMFLSILLVATVSASDASYDTSRYDEIEEQDYSTYDLTYDVDKQTGKSSLIKEDKNLKNSDMTDYPNNDEDKITDNTTKTLTTITTSNSKGIIGDDLTLNAEVLDENNENVTNGYVIFKLNGITIKDNGKLTGSTNNLKVYVKNGTATTNITADLNMRNAKTLTAVYSGSSTYNASRSNTATAQIALRNASLIVTSNTKTIKQGQNLTITAKIYDITTGQRKTTLTPYPDEYVYFKVNGITLKDEKGNTLKVKVVNGTATTQYNIPLGLSGVTDGKTFTIKNHTILAGYANKNYYPTATNTTTFQTERSNITIQFQNTTINKTSHQLSLNATIKDYLNNNVIGPNKYIIKINGITIKNETKPQYFYATNGNINITNLSIPVYTTYKSIEIVTQDRLAYKSQRNTTSNITDVELISMNDTGCETAIMMNITPVNGKPDISRLGSDYVFADEDGVYNITVAEIVRVRQLDSYCQQIYGYTPKYTFFRAENSNIKYVISREKWNVIIRSLNKYHVNQEFDSVGFPYKITVNLTGMIRYSPIYFDYQEWINGERYTCGPTAMSMISQGLNVYRSERKLAGVYLTTAEDGTDESSIIEYSPSVNMTLTNIDNTKESVKGALEEGSMIFWHISGHYMAIAAYNSVNDTFLCLNPSGPSHNIKAVQWATWTEVMNTDRALKENGFMKVTPSYYLNSTIMEFVKYYYYNMGGKYVAPANSQMVNTEDNPSIVTKEAPSV